MTDAELTLRETLNPILSDLGYENDHVEIMAITSGGGNYTSGLFLVTLKREGKQPEEIFAKVAIVGEKMRQLMNATKIFYTERFVYQELALVYGDLQDRHSVPEEERFVFPKFYGCNDVPYKETIVLENLAANGYATPNRFRSVTWEEAAAAIDTLARFHALSFAYQHESPENFEQVVQTMTMPRKPHDEKTLVAWKEMIGSVLKLVDEEYRGKIAQFMEEGGEFIYQKYNKPIGKPVLIHGDYRPSNLMVKKTGDTTIAMPVDYQTIRSSTPVADLVYFIAVGTDKAFRDQHYQALVERYHDQLGRALRNLGLDVNEVYPKATYESEFQQTLPYALVLSVLVLPIVMVDETAAPRTDGDADFSNFSVKHNDQCAERLRGLIRDLASWGVL